MVSIVANVVVHTIGQLCASLAFPNAHLGDSDRSYFHWYKGDCSDQQKAAIPGHTREITRVEHLDGGKPVPVVDLTAGPIIGAG